MGIDGFTCNLKKYRQLKDMTQEQLANAVGVRRETIMRLEKAQYNPSLKLAIDISRVVEAPIEEIFIFDDSFSALDFKTDAKLRQELDKMVKKTKNTVLIVGQRIASIMGAEQIIVLDEGKIVGKGTHEELMKNCDVYQEIAYSQLSKEELGHE